jgi:hypothetical protein
LPCRATEYRTTIRCPVRERIDRGGERVKSTSVTLLLWYCYCKYYGPRTATVSTTTDHVLHCTSYGVDHLSPVPFPGSSAGREATQQRRGYCTIREHLFPITHTGQLLRRRAIQSPRNRTVILLTTGLWMRCAIPRSKSSAPYSALHSTLRRRHRSAALPRRP